MVRSAQPNPTLDHPGPPPGADAPAGTLEIDWAIDSPCFADGRPGRLVFRLTWSADHRAFSIQPRLQCDDGSAVPGAAAGEPMASATITPTRDELGHLHLDAPGLLHATLAPPTRPGLPWRLLYARAPRVAQLGIIGGQAEGPRLSILTEPGEKESSTVAARSASASTPVDRA
jgi:hypothetical protein